MTRRGWVLFAIMSVVWGIPYLLIKVAVEEVPAPVLVFGRTAIGAVLLLPLALRGGGDGWSATEVLLTALCYGLAPLVADRYLPDLPTIPLTGACLGLAALIYMPAAIWTWPSEMPSGKALGAVVALGVICTALAFVAYVELIREIGPSRALVFIYVNPAVAVVAGVLILGEPLTALVVAAFVLILLGCALATRADNTPPPAAPEERESELQVRS